MITLTSEQQALVDLVTLSDPPPRIACLTGGPGTGKSTVIRSLIDALRAQGHAVALAAPSGKAAARLTETTGRQAMTVHRLLGLRPETSQFTPIQVPVVVVDEVSMLDTFLASQLLRACFEGGGRVRTLLLVGDPDQLPPVGPGQPFHDLLRARTVEVPTVRLTQVQRQALDSGIVRAAYAIKDGLEPEWAPDFRFVACPEADKIPATVWGVIQELQLDPERSQVLAPQKGSGKEAPDAGPGGVLGAGKLDAGVDAINRHIERVRTGSAPTGPVVRRRFRNGTKVIHVKNDYDLGVFNGELGFVVEAKPGEKEPRDELLVEIAGARKLYRGAQINMLQPAWALTVHKCVHPDTLVSTHEGLLPIRDVAPTGLIATSEGARDYTNHVRNPEGPGLRIVTKRGYELSVTPDHRMAVSHEGGHPTLVDAQDLRPGHTLRLVRGPIVGPDAAPALPPMPTDMDVRTVLPPRLPAILDEQAAELFGLIVADGTVFRRGFRLVKRHREVVERFAELVRRVFGVPIDVRPIASGKAFVAECCSSAIAKWLGSVGGMSPNEKAVPGCVLRSPGSVQRAFLRGLFEDGSAHVKAGGAFSHVEWSTAYERMGHVVQTMLLHLGIVASRRGFVRAGHGTWRLWIYGRDAAAFRDEIGFVARSKQDRLAGAGWSSVSLEPVELEAIESIEPIVMESMCVEVPGHGRFVQNGLDGSNSQGSEWRDVIFVAHRQHSFMLSRSLLYVAVTRARSRVVVVGEPEAVARAVKRVEDTQRRTLLQRWLGCERKATA